MVTNANRETNKCSDNALQIHFVRTHAHVKKRIYFKMMNKSNIFIKKNRIAARFGEIILIEGWTKSFPSVHTLDCTIIIEFNIYQINRVERKIQKFQNLVVVVHFYCPSGLISQIPVQLFFYIVNFSCTNYILINECFVMLLFL